MHFRRSVVADMGDGGSFGHAVALGDDDAGEVGKATGKLGSERRGAGLDPADFVVLGENAGLDGLAERIDGGRDREHHGDVFRDQESTQFLHVKARHQNESRSERQRKSQRHRESVDVVERQEAEYDVIGSERRSIRADGLIYIRDQVVVREHDALGHSSGAAGVGKCGNGLL